MNSINNLGIGRSKKTDGIYIFCPSSGKDNRGIIYTSFYEDIFKDYLPKELYFKHDKVFKFQENVCTEYMEIHFDEKSIVMDDYKQLKGYGINLREIKTATNQKGQKEELMALHEALKKEGAKWPIELWDMIQTTEISFVI